MLSDDNDRASLSRTLALLASPVLLAGFLGFTIAGIAAVLEGRTLPDISTFFAAGASAFLPYIVNQGRAAIDRVFSSRPAVPLEKDKAS